MAEIQIPSLDGASFGALISYPEGRNGSGLILIRGLFSKEDGLTKLADHYASLGFITVCPNLFYRQNEATSCASSGEPDWDQATKLYKNFDVEAGVRDLLATLAFIRKLPECGGKVGAVGYCLGSRLSFLMATRSDIDCAVGYYGVGIETLLDEVYDIRMPLLLHFGENDKLIPPQTRQRILTSLRRNPVITSHTYSGVEHGFARESSMTYNPEQAALANGRTDDFLKEHLLA